MREQPGEPLFSGDACEDSVSSRGNSLSTPNGLRFIFNISIVPDK